MIKKIIVGILVLCVSFAYAQQSTYSPYSVYGIGLRKFKGTIANTSMGGLSLYSDRSVPSLQNPALYADLELTAFAAGGSYSSATLKDASGKGKGQASTFDYLAISIPTKLFGFGFGLVPHSAVGYDTETINIQNTRQENIGRGNVNRVYFAAGAKIIKGLKLGAEAQYNFGRLENEITIFPASALNTREIQQTDVSGFSYTVSGIYDYLMKEDLKLRTSVIYSASGNLSFKNSKEDASVSETTLGDLIVNTTKRSDVPNRSFQLPSRWTFGASIFSKNKWFGGVEVYTQQNNDYQDRFATNNIVKYTDAFGLKLGGSFLPNYNSLNSYFERITYGVGFRYDELGLQINNTDVDEFGISFGLGLPLTKSYSNLDIGFELGSRGSTSAAVKEEFFTISVGLSLGDKWFRKRKYD